MSIRSIILLSLALLPDSRAMIAPQIHRAGGDVAIVASADVPVDNLSIFEVRHIFRGEKQYWKSNLKVVLLVPPEGRHERDVMLHVVYRMSESEYKQYWLGRIFRAEAISAPKTAETPNTVSFLINSHSGCITLINPGEVRPGEKVLKIDGKLPGEKGYALR